MDYKINIQAKVLIMDKKRKFNVKQNKKNKRCRMINNITGYIV